MIKRTAFAVLAFVLLCAIPSNGWGYWVIGDGMTSWGAVDAFNYEFTMHNQQGGALIAHLLSLPVGAKAGVMMRWSISPKAQQVALTMAPDGAIEFATRNEIGAVTTVRVPAAQTFPLWLRLASSARCTGCATTLPVQIEGAISTDGQAWQAVGLVTTLNPVWVGVAIDSTHYFAIGTKTFDIIRTLAIGEEMHVGAPSNVVLHQ